MNIEPATCPACGSHGTRQLSGPALDTFWYRYECGSTASIGVHPGMRSMAWPSGVCVKLAAERKKTTAAAA